MTFHDKNLDALNEITRKFEASEYKSKMPTAHDGTRQHGNFRDAHLEARAKMVGVWPEQRARK